MASTKPTTRLGLAYEEAAQEYLRSLPLEHFLEAISQSTQRKITLESLDLVHARRPEIQIFSELLVQYPRPRPKKRGQVVPDNMIVVHPEPIEADGSFDTPFQPALPFCVLEYVSKSNKRKDYGDNLRKYEGELKVPYYLRFYPDAQELSLFRHNKRKYVSVKPNEHERLAIPELNLEVALLQGWVRYWYQGKLLPLPADLQRDLDEAQRQLAEANRLAQKQARRADEEARRADEEARRADEEHAARLVAEEELARLRAQLARPRKNGGS